MSTVTVTLNVNGHRYSRDVPPRMLLSDFLRDELALKGTHVGCEHGVCGTCNVLLDGRAVRSCLMFAVQADGAEIRTVEGLASNGKLHPLQEAFWQKHGLQCGFCTPGMLISATELLERCQEPTDEQIREAVSSNLCRCTGYFNIVEAVRHAAADLKGGTR
jgi:aerobic carbon-monoxide dehydrogenase small subunit